MEELLNQINAPTLRDKPKLFFVNKCRYDRKAELSLRMSFIKFMCYVELIDLCLFFIFLENFLNIRSEIMAFSYLFM